MAVLLSFLLEKNGKSDRDFADGALGTSCCDLFENVVEVEVEVEVDDGMTATYFLFRHWQNLFGYTNHCIRHFTDNLLVVVRDLLRVLGSVECKLTCEQFDHFYE